MGPAFGGGDLQGARGLVLGGSVCLRFRVGKRIRSKETCPWCGAKYERFRSQAVPTYAAAYDTVIEMSREAHARGDYSLNASHGRVLGHMRAIKKGAWRDEHLDWCAMGQASCEVPF